MSVLRVFALMGIFILSTLAWLVLGSVSTWRSMDRGFNLDSQVESLWGGRVVQKAPMFYVKVPGSQRVRAVMPSANKVLVDLDLAHRRKGLIWYATYAVDFDASYRIVNDDPVEQHVHVLFAFPAQDATYDNFALWVDGQPREAQLDTREGLHEIITLAPGEAQTLRVRYRTRGIGDWRYQLSGEYGRVKDLFMQVSTNFRNVDFSETSLSPMTSEPIEGGLLLTWKAQDLITTRGVGLVMPDKINPGPLSARMSFFAPVCLLFFFVLISALGILRKISIHPMHYLFVAAGFFAFHLLFAYLIDIINIHLAFVLSSTVSMALVSFYLAGALGRQFPWSWAFAGQMLYLVLFSYSFFLEGMTGLTVTIGSILTLALIMRLTLKTNWTTVFTAKEGTPPSVSV